MTLSLAAWFYGAAPFFNSAKMSRPPAVCSALETIIFTLVPIRGRA